MKIKNIKKDIALYAIGDFVVVGVMGFLLLPLYTSVLSKEDFGRYSIILTNINFFTYLFLLGIPSAASCLYFGFRARDKHLGYLGGLIAFHFLYAAFLGALLYWFGESLWFSLSPGLSASPFLAITCMLAFFSFIPELYLLYLRLEGRAGKFLTVQLAKVIVFGVLVFWMLVVKDGSLFELLLAQIVTFFLFWLLFLVIFIAKLQCQFTLSGCIPTVKLALPFLMSYTAFFVNQKFSLIALQRYVTFEEIALFSFGQQVAMVLTLVNGAVVKAIQPIIYASEHGELSGIANFLGYRYKLLMLYCCASLVVFSSLMVTIFSGGNYAGSEIFIILIAISGLVFTYAAVENSIIIYFKKTNMLFCGVLVGAILNVSFNMILIPIWGTIGAAFSMILSATGVFVVSHVFSRKLLNLNFNYRLITAYLLICILFLSVFFSLEDVFTGKLGLLFEIFIFINLSAFFVFYFRKTGQIDEFVS